jgi:hypothetical protein
MGVLYRNAQQWYLLNCTRRKPNSSSQELHYIVEVEFTVERTFQSKQYRRIE